MVLFISNFMGLWWIVAEGGIISMAKMLKMESEHILSMVTIATTQILLHASVSYDGIW